MPEPLNYRTARPTLELLLAQADYEVPDVAPDNALPVFADFLVLEQAPGTIDAGFQTGVVNEDPSEGLLTLVLGLRYPLPMSSIDPDADQLYRSVGIRWDLTVPDPGAFEVKAVWAEDFPDLNEFMEAVRATPEWQMGQRARVWQCTAFAEDD
jgi:hypothetical protein